MGEAGRARAGFINVKAFLSWLAAFGLTQLIEMPIYRHGLGARPWAAFGASAITHPIVWFVIPGVWRSLYIWGIQWDGRLRLSPAMYLWGYGVLAEGFAVLAEGIYFWALFGKAQPRGRCFRWALIANFASAMAGFLLNRCFGWP